MTDDVDTDAILSSLARLRPVGLRPDRDIRIVNRCHSVLAMQTKTRMRRTRRQRALARAANIGLAALLGSYATVTLVQLLRLIQ